jgi:hypothetical protein
MTFKQTHSLLIYLVFLWSFGVIANTSVKVKKLNQSSQLRSAIMERKAGNYHQAIDLLSQLREKHVKHKRINIELALNYIKLHQYDSAELIVQHLQALTLSEREQKTLEKLKRLLERRMRKSLSPHSFTVDFGLAVGIDIVSNRFPILVFDDFYNSDEYLEDEGMFNDEFFENDTEYGYTVEEYSELSDFRDIEETAEQSEVSYTREFFNINYRYRPDNQFELFSHSTQWILDNDLSIDYRHLNQSDNNNYLNAEWNSSFYILQINRWLLEISALASAYNNDSKRVLNKYGGRLAFTVPFQRLKLKLAVDKQRKLYHGNLSKYDANITTPWGEISYQLSSQIRLVTGMKLRKLTARDEFESYDNRDVFLGVYFYPLTSLSTYIIYHDQNLTYKIDDPDFVNWAKEKKKSVAFGVKYQIDQSISISLNGSLGNKKIELGYGEDDWRRIEASIVYRF